MRSVAVGNHWISTNTCREVMQICETCPIAVDREHRAVARTAATLRRPEQSASRQSQSGEWKGSITVGNGWITTRTRRERVQVRETRAIRIDPEHHAMTRRAAAKCRPVQGVARSYQAAVAIGACSI